MDRLDNPQDDIRTVHIAGTNGKGSVSATISSILAAAGYRVGLNTSPHLIRLNERLVIDGLPASDEFLGEMAFEIRNAVEKCGKELSFHEAITAIAFLGFREIEVDWGIFEVGLGGRLDASNIIKRPAATVLVTVDYDHQHILGNSLDQIALEKAGILKAGVPHISGTLPNEAFEVVVKRAQQLNLPHYIFGKDFKVLYEVSNREFNLLYSTTLGARPTQSMQIAPALSGEHQIHNMAVAAMTASVLGIRPEACQRGVKDVFWPARLEWIDYNKKRFLLDCGHNPAGITAVRNYLVANDLSGIDITFGVLDTKNWQAMVLTLGPVAKTWRLLLPSSDRALPQAILRDFIYKTWPKAKIESYDSNYKEWLQRIMDSDVESSLVVGSIYMVGHVREMLEPPLKPLWKMEKNRTTLS